MPNLNLANQPVPLGIPGGAGRLKPLLVSKKTGRELIGCGPTKFWELCKAGLVEIVNVAGREMVVYASLERLAHPTEAKTVV